jgi:hypothetical protein
MRRESGFLSMLFFVLDGAIPASSKRCAVRFQLASGLACGFSSRSL